jgi:hypothetical protein
MTNGFAIRWYAREASKQTAYESFPQRRRANSVHLEFVVQRLLDFLPTEAIRSVVVFTGEAEFKTEIPQGVITISGLVAYLRAQTAAVMSLNRVQFCVGRLETARLAISRETDVEHTRSLERRRGGLDERSNSSPRRW